MCVPRRKQSGHGRVAGEEISRIITALEEKPRGSGMGEKERRGQEVGYNVRPEWGIT